METIVIGASLFQLSRTYVDSLQPALNLADQDPFLINNIVTPVPGKMIAWVRYDLSPLKGKKRIVSAIITMSPTFLAGTTLRLRVTEPVAPLIIESQITYSNLPAANPLPVKDVIFTDAESELNVDVTSLITDWVEGRRDNLGLLLQLVPPTPNANVGISIPSSREPGSTTPLMTVILDPTVKPPSRR